MLNQTAKLTNILIGKAVLETLLVGTFSVVFLFRVLPPTFHGWGEAVTSQRLIAGWAVNDASPWERVQVQLFVDGKLVATQVAEKSRVDVQAAGWSKDEWHGYKFFLNELSSGEHTAKVYAVHQSRGGELYTLQLLGDPIVFGVDQKGNWSSAGAK